MTDAENVLVNVTVQGDLTDRIPGMLVAVTAKSASGESFIFGYKPGIDPDGKNEVYLCALNSMENRYSPLKAEIYP